MPNRYKRSELERAIQIIEWGGGSDFKGQLEYIAKCCGWDVIATYAAMRAEQQPAALEPVSVEGEV